MEIILYWNTGVQYKVHTGTGAHVRLEGLDRAKVKFLYKKMLL